MSVTILDKIVAIKRNRIGLQKVNTDISGLMGRASAMRENAIGHRLKEALIQKDRTNIIAEIKRASPSKGMINEDIDVGTIARKYYDGGAAAISVVTEEDHFKGTLDDLITVKKTVSLPVLRKDFVIDEFQVYESAAAGADAILLIVAVLTAERLSELLRLGRDKLGMDVIIEVHTVEELEIAANADADIIGVNNRNLRTFEVSLVVSSQLIKKRPPNTLMISESGISTRNEIDGLKGLGYNGFLIGETLLRRGDVTEMLRRLSE
jgi:indole-3-glycerol phosphate synthase